MGRFHQVPMIGRDAELARLLQVLADADAGEARCALVTGEAGIGKSRLAAEAVARVDGALIVWGHAAATVTGEIPFGVVADTLRHLIRVEGPAVLTRFEREALAPLLPGGSPAGRDDDRLGLLSTCVDLLERLAVARPVVWVVEDLHWADSPTRDLLNVALRTVGAPLRVVATVRTDDPDRSVEDETALAAYLSSMARLPTVEVISLERLTSEGVHEFLGHYAERQVPERLVSRITRLSDGIPFLVEELAAAQGRPDRVVTASVIPERLARLSTDARRLVDALAVGDGHLRISLVEKVVRATPDELDGALADSVSAGVVVRDAEQDQVGFRHDLLREMVDRAMGPGARRSWHRRWAEVLEAYPGLLAADPAALAIADHWHHARDLGRAAAAAYAALPAAERIGGPDDKLALWTRVLAGWDERDLDSAVGAVTLREVVGLALLTDGTAASLRTLREFFDHVPRDRLEPAAQAALRMLAAELSEAKALPSSVFEETLVRATDACDWLSAPADPFTLLLLTAIGPHLPLADPRGDRFLERARHLAEELGLRVGACRAAIASAYRIRLREGPALAADYLTDALEQLLPLPAHLLCLLTGNLVCELAVVGRHREADAVATQTLEQLRHPEAVGPMWEHLVENAAFTWTCTGQWHRARGLLERAALFWDDDRRSSNLRLDRIDLLQTGAASVDRWRAHLGDPVPFGPPEAEVRSLLAYAAAIGGDLEEMRRLLAPIWDRDPIDVDDMFWRDVVDSARFDADAADGLGAVHSDAERGGSTEHAEAARHLERLQSVVAAWRRHGALGEAWPLDLSAQIDRFHGRDPRPALEAALGAWQRIDHIPDVAVTHLSLAQAHARCGDRRAARQHLLEGRTLAHTLGARPLLDRASAIERTYGLSTAHAGGSSGLTEREREVLRLITEGRTNSEIAEVLFMSPKTASVHVSRILTKLGASNRTEAAAIAHRRALLDAR